MWGIAQYLLTHVLKSFLRVPAILEIREETEKDMVRKVREYVNFFFRVGKYDLERIIILGA